MAIRAVLHCSVRALHFPSFLSTAQFSISSCSSSNPKISQQQCNGQCFGRDPKSAQPTASHQPKTKASFHFPCWVHIATLQQQGCLLAITLNFHMPAGAFGDEG